MRQVLLPLILAAALAAAGAHAAAPASDGTAAPPAKNAASPPLSSGASTLSPSEAEAKVRFHGCGPEVSAVLGGDATTACLPDDPGTHGEPNESPESPRAWQGGHHPD